MWQRTLQISMLGVMIMTSPLSADQRQDARDILQLLLNSPILSQYYHFDVEPDRAPLKIVNRSGVELGAPDLTAGGKKASIVTRGDKKSLELTAFTVGPDTADVSFAFRIEGITGTGRFAKSSGVWALSAINVEEH